METSPKFINVREYGTKLRNVNIKNKFINMTFLSFFGDFASHHRRVCQHVPNLTCNDGHPSHLKLSFQLD